MRGRLHHRGHEFTEGFNGFNAEGAEVHGEITEKTGEGGAERDPSLRKKARNAGLLAWFRMTMWLA
jgi:hypothetical protein